MRIALEIKGVIESPSVNALILKEQDGNRVLAIIIGPYEARYIARAILGIEEERPLTHDLFLDTLEALDVNIKFVVVNALIDKVYYSELVLDVRGETVIIDARPSDSITLAFKSGTAIYMEQSIFDANSEEAISDEPEPKETTLPEAFKNFIGNLSELDDLDNPTQK